MLISEFPCALWGSEGIFDAYLIKYVKVFVLNIPGGKQQDVSTCVCDQKRLAELG